MNNFLAFILYIIIKTLNATYRYRELNPQVLSNIKEQSPNGLYIFALWHQNMIASILFKTKTPHVTIASDSRDGELIATVLAKFKYEVARGSSTRGGAKGLKGLIRHIKKGLPGAITIDGPKGPPHEVKNGILDLARITQTPIVPYVVYPQKYWSLKSWDKFRIPKPFARIFIRYENAIYVDKKINAEEYERLRNQIKVDLESGEDQVRQALDKNN